jgi:putative transposase
MARSLRIEFPGALYHVIVRGNQKQDIFLDDEDRRAFLERDLPLLMGDPNDVER